ncbi:MAG: 50S ribosomal protein L1, partial [Gammaproteobacteria bacterium]|nr:50S ribosomal protein L1 [Gammaproteobacteria bacterium]
MAKLSKRTQAIREKLEAGKAYAIDDALNLLKDFPKAKFVESVDVSINLGIDSRKSDQNVRGATVLPNGTGKTIRVAVFAQGENADKATAAGADIVGFEDLAESIKGGAMDFDVVIATPDAMRVVGTL